MESKKVFKTREFEEVDGGYYDKDGFYYTPNGSFWDVDGVYFDRKGMDLHEGYYDENKIYHPGPGWIETLMCYEDEVSNILTKNDDNDYDNDIIDDYDYDYEDSYTNKNNKGNKYKKDDECNFTGVSYYDESLKNFNDKTTVKNQNNTDDFTSNSIKKEKDNYKNFNNNNNNTHNSNFRNTNNNESSLYDDKTNETINQFSKISMNSVQSNNSNTPNTTNQSKNFQTFSKITLKNDDNKTSVNNKNVQETKINKNVIKEEKSVKIDGFIVEGLDD